MLIVFDDIIADMETNKKSNPIVTELILRVRKYNISLVFMLQSIIKKLLVRKLIQSITKSNKTKLKMI